MAIQVRWAIPASEDLRAIYDYIAVDSTHYACTVIEEIFTATDRLAQFPLIGHVFADGNDPSVREILVYSYRVIYRVHPDCVVIGAVIHGARSLQNAMKGRVL
jgi:toxin ParE1/3/4